MKGKVDFKCQEALTAHCQKNLIHLVHRTYLLIPRKTLCYSFNGYNSSHELHTLIDTMYMEDGLH